MIVHFRMYVDGRLADDQPLVLGRGDLDLVNLVGERHSLVAEQAEAAGSPWMVEIEFPDGEHVRFGTDAEGMVEPHQVEDFVEALGRKGDDIDRYWRTLGGRWGNSIPGWWGMCCWNGLSPAQQRRLIEVGNLPFGYVPLGECVRGAEVAIETSEDEADGPRFYCLPCARDYLGTLPGSATPNQGENRR